MPSFDEEHAVHTALVPPTSAGISIPNAGAASTAHPSSTEAMRSLQELDADDTEYSQTHTHPRPGHDHEKPPTAGILSFLYAFEGGDPDSEVDVVHEFQEEGEAPERKPPAFSFRTLLSYTGPGFLMCIAYLDPGNLEADLQVGAYTGSSYGRFEEQLASSGLSPISPLF